MTSLPVTKNEISQPEVTFYRKNEIRQQEVTFSRMASLRYENELFIPEVALQKIIFYHLIRFC